MKRPCAWCCAIVALASARVPAVRAQDRPLSEWERQARDRLRELVEINTTESSGSSAAAARAMAARLKAAGFPDSDVVVIEHAPRKGNLIARLRGRDRTRKPIVLLSHLDVVEAKPEDWTLPPFQFIEKNGVFYGRGVADDKDEGAIGITNLIRMKREQYVPDRDIVVALTADEEGGPNNGVEWILANRPELLRAEFVFNEGGGGRVRDGRKLSHDVQASEKKVLNLELEVTNPGGHSSVPVKDNAIYHLAAALVRIGAFDFPIRLNEITRAYFAKSADVAGGPMGAAMRGIAANERDTVASRTLTSDPRYNSQLRTTCVATMLDGGHARNALPQRARATVNCRILPDESAGPVQRALEQAVADPQVHFRVLGEPRDSPPSPLPADLFREVERVSRELWPGLPVIPTMSTGATDGTYLRNAGIPTYGVSGLFYENPNAHGMNEQIPAEGFYQGLEFMYRLVKSLTGGGTA
jgi:acetylornithine deacetylase/succinyl-diaminopimelate desuccinylase-like protein